jgi:hypothetical protein
VNIIDAIDDEQIFARFFRKRESWLAWRVFLKALFALPMTSEEGVTYVECTGRSSVPAAPATEAWLVIGRRGGKSFILALIAVFLACFKDWRPFLGPGEVGTVAVIAADRRQARAIMRYALGLLKAVPMLKGQIEGVTRESITLKRSIAIEVHTASFRTTRGYTIVAALLDEMAFWSVDEGSAEPDVEVVNAIRPGMATIPGAILLGASSPHARRGSLWDAWRKHFGKSGDPILVWQAATRVMNPSVPQSYIDQHVADDPQRASAEYGAQFRSDVEQFVSREAVEACVSAGCFERPYAPGHAYCGFVDPSGGSSDSMTLCIAHLDAPRETAIVDVLREFKPPFSPEATVIDMAKTLKAYGITSIEGDRYGGEWPREVFLKHGVLYECSQRPKSELYVDALPLINSRRVDMLDHARAVNQFVSLERRVARSGKDSIDHPPGANNHDDLANVIAGAATIAVQKGVYNMAALTDSTPSDELGIEAWRRMRLQAYLQSGGQIIL